MYLLFTDIKAAFSVQQVMVSTLFRQDKIEVLLHVGFPINKKVIIMCIVHSEFKMLFLIFIHF